MDEAPVIDRPGERERPGEPAGEPRASLAARPLLALVFLYQATLRPFFGGHCRFHPSCSEFAVEALRTHGALRGSWLALHRLVRCHPFGGGGYDPVPPRRD